MQVHPIPYMMSGRNSLLQEAKVLPQFSRGQCARRHHASGINTSCYHLSRAYTVTLFGYRECHSMTVHCTLQVSGLSNGGGWDKLRALCKRHFLVDVIVDDKFMLLTCWCLRLDLLSDWSEWPGDNIALSLQTRALVRNYTHVDENAA